MKRFICWLALFSVLFGIHAQQFNLKVYKIGEKGPAGGIVFYDKGRVTEGWRYLEAAPNDAGPVQWGTYDEDIGGTSSEVGKGKANTQLIISKLRQSGEINKAAQLCTVLNINRYNDWFLPSKDELNWMYENLKSSGLGGFQNDWYWSSSQDGNYTVWVQHFRYGSQYFANKLDICYIRAIRAF
jgi:hypothetical protein